MAVHGMLQIYSNDGSTSLFYDSAATPGTSYVVNETGLMNRADTQVYTYTGNKKFIGFADVANATVPTYAIGDFTSTVPVADYLTLYIVEEEEKPSSNKYEVLYNDEVIGIVAPGEKLVIHCAGDTMEYNLVVRPASDGPVMITFTVDGTTYQAENGMTWKQWCNSEYNTDGFYHDADFIQTVNKANGYYIAVYPTDAIIANNNYTLKYAGGGGDID